MTWSLGWRSQSVVCIAVTCEAFSVVSVGKDPRFQFLIVLCRKKHSLRTMEIEWSVLVHKYLIFNVPLILVASFTFYVIQSNIRNLWFHMAIGMIGVKVHKHSNLRLHICTQSWTWCTQKTWNERCYLEYNPYRQVKLVTSEWVLMQCIQSCIILLLIPLGINKSNPKFVTSQQLFAVIIITIYSRYV